VEKFGNAEAFADGLTALLDDAAFNASCRANARRFAEEHFAREALGRRFVAFLEQNK
jgi:glycosyltransferase involved in cell wall biosynthesis